MLHREAREILRAAFAKVVGRAPTERALDMVQAVAWGETLYGRGGQFAAMAKQGLHNWGALEKGAPPCGDGFWQGKDHDAKGNLIDVCFYAYKTDEEAAAKYLGILLQHRGDPQRRVLDAVENGSPEDMAAAMRAFNYFVAPVADYAKMIRNNLGVGHRSGGITDDGKVFTTDPPGTPPPPSQPGPVPVTPGPPIPVAQGGNSKGVVVGIGVLGLVGVVGYYLRSCL